MHLDASLIPGQVTADCEVVDGWGFAQDVNAWSSLGYVVIGFVVVVVVVRRRLPVVFLAFAGLAAIEGVGSLLDHGTGGEVAQVLHDGALIAMLGFGAGWQVGRLRNLGAAQVGAALGALLGASIGVVAGVAAVAVLTNAMVMGSVAIAAAAELLARRRVGSPVWNAGLATALIVAVATWMLGRGDSPLCGARSWAQPHALWHVLSALVLLWWVDRVFDVDLPQRAPRMGRRTVDRLVGGRNAARLPNQRW